MTAKARTTRTAKTVDTPLDPEAQEMAEEFAKIVAEDKAAARKAPLKGSGLPRKKTSHTDCTHAISGAEGKKARAACRRERAAKAA